MIAIYNQHVGNLNYMHLNLCKINARTYLWGDCAMCNKWRTRITDMTKVRAEKVGCRDSKFQISYDNFIFRNLIYHLSGLK